MALCENPSQEITVLQALLEEQAAELRRAWDKVHRLRECIQHPNGPLQGKKIAVIGPSFRQECYKSMVRRLGGICLFAPSEEKPGLAYRMISKADGAVFLTSYTSHKASNLAKTAAEQHGRPIVFLNSTGLDSLEHAIVNELAPMLWNRNRQMLH